MKYKIDKNTVVLILGGTGTVGSSLVEKFIELNVKKIKVVSRDESKLYALMVNSKNSDKIEQIIGDIRDIDSIEETLQDVDIVINAAAMKHVLYCEKFPEEAYKTNVLGTINIVKLCQKWKIKKFILISSDKVVSPTTAYGATKLMAERVVLSAHDRNNSCDFNIVRFGNIVGSRNSVLDLVKMAMNNGKAISIPSIPITRFVMTKHQSTKLVTDAIENSDGGQIFLLDMPVVAIKDLIYGFVGHYAKRSSIDRETLSYKKHVIGSNEKEYESLLTASEYQRAYKLSDDLIVIFPKIEGSRLDHIGVDFKISSNSKEALTTKQIEDLLESSNL